MKKYLICAAFGVFFGVMFLTACNEPTTTTDRVVERNTYATYGTYYSDGTIVTDDGNAWDYFTEDVNNDTPVVVVFDDISTPNYIYDDEILEIVER